MKKIRKSFGTSVLKGNVVDSLNSNNPDSAPSIRVINEEVKGVILYENSLGTSDAFQIADDISNYKYVAVLGYENLGGTEFNSGQCEVTSNTIVGLTVPRMGGTYFYLFGTSVTFSGTSATFGKKNEHVYFNPGAGQVSQNGEAIDSKVLVTKVIGYK